MQTLLTTLNLLGGLAIFLFGMKIMSDGMQKVSGDKMRQLLGIATNNKYAATFSGMLVTSIIQSSSATTVMVVGFASAGLLNLYQSLGVIFGANIGTTMTAWIVSIFGFKFQISLFALPVIAIGFFTQFASNRWVTVRRIGEAMVGFGLLFLGLDIMKNTIPADFAQNPVVAEWIARFNPDNLINLAALIFTGTLLTVILQSSSAVMAMTLTLAAAGIINFPTACALVLGENIGTTITANLAAIGTNKTARRAAIGHFLFNFIGVVWVSAIFMHMIHFIDWLVPGDPYTKETAALTSVLPYHISAFHSVFNVVNTLLMLPLLNQLAKLTLFLIPKSKREDHQRGNELVFLSTRFAHTPELGLIAVHKEAERMMSFVTKMTDKIMHAIKMDDDKMFERLIDDIKEAEKTTDVLEHKINLYLTQLTHGNLSRDAVAHTVTMFDVINSIERMGDCGEKIARILEKFHTKSPFLQADIDDLETIAKKTKEITKETRRIIMYFPAPTRESGRETHEWFDAALKREEELNALRKQFLKTRSARIHDGQEASPDSITAYADILNNFERIGDYALRVTESILGLRAPAKETTPVNGFPSPTADAPIQ